jgi:hypothetical protein
MRRNEARSPDSLVWVDSVPEGLPSPGSTHCLAHYYDSCELSLELSRSQKGEDMLEARKPAVSSPRALTAGCFPPLVWDASSADNHARPNAMAETPHRAVMRGRILI